MEKLPQNEETTKKEELSLHSNTLDLNESNFTPILDLDDVQQPEPHSTYELQFVYLQILRFEGENSDWPYQGEGTVYFEGGHTYKGMVNEGLLHGHGLLTMANGLMYEGEFVCNKPMGHGTYTWPDGSTYTGGVNNGKRHGIGTYKCNKNNLQYTGEWYKSKFHGKGTIYYDENQNSWYKGDWVMNQKEGWGERCYPSGSTYVGEWKNNVRHGEGTMIWKSSAQEYSGTWKDGVPHGHGTHIWHIPRSNESQYFHCNKYKGEFYQGKRHGEGSLYYAGGAIFKGEWVNNKKCGRGEFTLRDGRVFIGEIIDDRIVSPNIIGMVPSTPLGAFPPSNVILLGPYMVLRIQSVLDEMPEKRRAIEHRQTEYMVLQLEKDLRFVYSFYSKLGQPPSPDNTYQMSRLQFRCLLKDCNIHRHGLSLKEIDYLIYENDTCPVKVPTPFTPLLLHDYLSSLIILSYHIYKKDMQDEKHHILASCILKLMTEDIMPNATHVKGFLFKYPRIEEVAVKYMKKSWEVHLAFCNIGRVCKHRTMTSRQVLRMFKELHLFDDHLTPSKLIEIIINESCIPNITSPLDLEITFLEFFETLIQCANEKCQSILNAEKEELVEDEIINEELPKEMDENLDDALNSSSDGDEVDDVNLGSQCTCSSKKKKTLDKFMEVETAAQPTEMKSDEVETLDSSVDLTIRNIHYFFNHIFFPAFSSHQKVTKEMERYKSHSEMEMTKRQ